MSQSQTRKITHIAQWTSAFIRFVAVYSEKFPQESAQLMKYGEVIRDLAFRRPGLSWYHYNMQFRQLRETVTYRWDMIHYDLWVPSATFYPFQGFNRQRQQSNTYAPRRSSSPFLKNCCWAFNRSGRCAKQDCNFLTRVAFAEGRTLQNSAPCNKVSQGLICKVHKGGLVHQWVLESPSSTMGAPVYRGDKFKLVTPVQVDEFVKWIKGFEFQDYLIQGLQEGFRIGFEGPRFFRESYNLKSCGELPQVISEKKCGGVSFR